MPFAGSSRPDVTSPSPRNSWTRPGGTPHSAADFASAIADLAAGQDIDFDGVTGTLDFDGNGDVVGAYEIFQTVDEEGGKIVVTETAVQP